MVSRYPNKFFLGLDLAGSPKRASGFCILDNRLEARVGIVYSNEEIVSLAMEYSPSIIAIDAPLSLPKRGVMRDCDSTLRKLGIRIFPPAMGPMKMLTERGIYLYRLLTGKGFKVIEVYPGGAQDFLGLPRKKKLAELREGLARLGIKGLPASATGDELDAATAAYVAYLYCRGEALEIKGKECIIVMPKPKVRRWFKLLERFK